MSTVLADIKTIKNPIYQAFRILWLGYTVAPIVAGLDKFTNFLVNWEKYLAPIVANVIPAGVFMRTVGIVEIAAGILVAVKPKIGGLVVGVWLLGIVMNLLLIPGYYDVALRDFGLSLGAFALARLGLAFDTGKNV